MEIFKKYFLSILLAFSFTLVFSQEAEFHDYSEIESLNQNETDNSEQSNARSISIDKNKSFFEQSDFILKLPVSVYLNTIDTAHSAPSPILFSPGFGFIWPTESFISFEPTLSFFTSYYLLYEGKALPAEIENRTATTLNFLLDIPVAFALNLTHTKVQLNAGVAMLMRFGWKANGAESVSDNEISEINKYFWANTRFLYISGAASLIFNLPAGTKIGPFFSLFLPVGSIFAAEGLNGMMMSVGLKVSF